VVERRLQRVGGKEPGGTGLPSSGRGGGGWGGYIGVGIQWEGKWRARGAEGGGKKKWPDGRGETSFGFRTEGERAERKGGGARPAVLIEKKKRLSGQYREEKSAKRGQQRGAAARLEIRGKRLSPRQLGEGEFICGRPM